MVMMRGAAAMRCRHEDAGDGEGCVGGRVCESIDALAMAGEAFEMRPLEGPGRPTRYLLPVIYLPR